jgi:hypothetical protein
MNDAQRTELAISFKEEGAVENMPVGPVTIYEKRPPDAPPKPGVPYRKQCSCDTPELLDPVNAPNGGTCKYCGDFHQPWYTLERARQMAAALGLELKEGDT